MLLGTSTTFLFTFLRRKCSHNFSKLHNPQSIHGISSKEQSCFKSFASSKQQYHFTSHKNIDRKTLIGSVLPFGNKYQSVPRLVLNSRQILWYSNDPKKANPRVDPKHIIAIVAVMVSAACLIISYYLSEKHSIRKRKRLPELLFGGFGSPNNFIADVVEDVALSVVNVEMRQRSPYGHSITLTNGSGSIVSKDGVILTNAHVVADNTYDNSYPVITLRDGRVMDGEVIAVDPIVDLASIKITASGLKPIKVAQSLDVRPGDWIIALGTPLSLKNTVTSGIVSNAKRSSGDLGFMNKTINYIQTDAVINFGQSGGPLVNMNGVQVGVNCMKISPGVSFAIPSPVINKFLNKSKTLMLSGRTENGFSSRRYMGITMLTMSKEHFDDQMSTFDIDYDPRDSIEGGVFIYSVIPGTPAEHAGLLSQDIIVEINEQPILTSADVYDIVEKSSILHVKILREGVEKTVRMETRKPL